MSTIENIQVEKIKVSPFNIRVAEDFGETPEDQEMMRNIRGTGILQPITVRPVGENFEVVIGMRRFLAAKAAGMRSIPCLVKEMSDMEALDASLIENIQRKDVDPITKAKAVRQRLDMTGEKMTAYARKVGKAKSTLSEWLSLLELTPKFQEKVSKASISERDAIKAARLDLTPKQQDTLAELSATGGKEAFKCELDRLASGKEKRGAPPGLLVVRLVFRPDTVDKRTYAHLIRLSKAKEMDVANYCKSILVDHIRAAGL